MTRPDRQTEVAQERRRRRDSTLDRTADLKLAIPDEVRAKHPDKVFRWVNDNPSRMHAMTQRDDWDRVEGVERLPVGTDANGQPQYQVLCAKPKEFWEEDQRAKAKRAHDDMAQMVRTGKGDANASEDDSSVALAGNQIFTEGYKP